MSEIERLRSVLAATGPPPDAQELSELLWLACHMDEPEPPFGLVPPVDTEPAGPVPGFADGLADVPSPPREPPGLRKPTVPTAPAEVPLHPLPAAAPAAGTDTGAEEVLVPTAPMLADSRGLQRALRPLKRRVPSRHRRELDEDATAARIADSGLWAPLLVPAPERWLTLSLVVDTGPTMRLWRPLARELAEVLVRQGAFADVHVSYLDGDRVAGVPGAPPQDAGTLLHASGRHAVLVLSDCSGPHWWDGRAARAVRRWALTGPTAILQPLPERLWRRTAAPTSPGHAHLPRPGAANSDLRFVPFDGDPPAGVPVPVLEIAPRWLASWAGLVTGAGPRPLSVASLHAAGTVPGGAPGSGAAPGSGLAPGSGAAPGSGLAPGSAVERERELPVDERVRRFLTSASPAAAELAAHVAVSVPSLPVMRLIQHRILDGSGPGQLAEVLLSGLLRPVDGTHYAFVPGAREALLDTLPRPEAQHTRHVLEAVSAEIERRAGTSAEIFRALVPSSGGRVRLVADTDHFATVSPQTRAHLSPALVTEGPTTTSPPPDPPDAPVGDVLALNRGEGPRRPVIGSDEHGAPVSPFPHELKRDVRHGLIVGDTAERQRLLRSLTLAVAATHSPEDVSLIIGGLGEHPLGGDLDLPHVLLSVDELLGRPDELRGFLELLDDQLHLDSGSPQGGGATVLVVVDTSLTLPSSRPEVAETLLRLAQRGKSAGVALVLASSTVDGGAPWDRLMPLLDWRIATRGVPPRTALQLLGRPVTFDGDRDAYLRSAGGAPVRFTPAAEPGRDALDAFLLQARLLEQAPPPGESPPPPAAPAAPFPPGQYTILACDMAQFEDASRTDDLREQMREALFRMLDASLRAAGVRLSDCYREDRGDGVLVVMPPGGGTEALLSAAVDTLAAEVRRHNETAPDGARIGLRVAVHAGELRHDGLGVVGFALNYAFRVLDARGLRDVLEEPGVWLAVAVSRRVYEDVVQQGAESIAPDEYRRIDVPMRENDERAWVRAFQSGDTTVPAVEAPQPSMLGRPNPPVLLDRRGLEATDLPTRVHVSELPAFADGRVVIGVRNAEHGPVLLDFREDSHLLVAATPGAGRTNLVRVLLRGLARRSIDPGDISVCVFDPRGHLRAAANRLGLESPVGFGIQYTETSDEFNEFVEETDALLAGPESYAIVIDGNGSVGEEYLVSMLRDGGAPLHLVLAVTDDRPPSPLASALSDLGEPLLLLGPCRGEIARPFDALLSEPMPPGRGLLVRQREGELVMLQVADASPPS